MEMLKIKIYQKILVGAYIPDGRRPDGSQQWIAVLISYRHG
jgi:hypothetical protein